MVGPRTQLLMSMASGALAEPAASAWPLGRLFDDLARLLSERQLIGNYQVLIGFPVAHAWQATHGAIVPGHRLVPKQPFVLGGESAVSNLYSLDAPEGMRVRADLALQIKDMPDGAQIRYWIVE